MCGRYYRELDKQKIAERMGTANDLASLVLAEADYNVAPTTFQPVVRGARDSTDRELVLMRWGPIRSSPRVWPTVEASARSTLAQKLSRPQGRIAVLSSAAAASVPHPTFMSGRSCRQVTMGTARTRNNRIDLSYQTAMCSPSLGFGTHGRNRRSRLRLSTSGCRASRS
jgi:hypothetical protein